VVGVAGENEGALDAVGLDEASEQRCWKLDGLARMTARHNSPRGATIVIEEFLRRDAQIELITVHAAKRK